MSNSAILDIRASFGAAFIGLLVSATSVLLALRDRWFLSY